MKKLICTALLCIFIAAPAVAYYRMTPQEMTDEQLIQQHREMEYEQRKQERISVANRNRGSLIGIAIAEKRAKDAHYDKFAIMEEMQRRGIQP